ncbi:MAG: T9SS type A sorting domain-containing protein [Chitinophagales bacterium]
MKRTLLTLLAFLMLSAQWLYALESEPNDVRNDADKLNLNASNTGAMDISGDVDWWKVTTTSDGKLDITLTSGNGLYCNFRLYDNDGISLLVENHTNGTLTISKDGLSPGTYYIHISAYFAGQLPTYTVSNFLNVAPLANEPEPNDTYNLANVLAPTGSVTGHIGYDYNGLTDDSDWWSVTTTGNGSLTLQFASNNGQYVYWTLYDNNGTLVLNTNHTNGTASYVEDGLAAGTYYVQIYPYYAGGFTPYTLTSTFTAPPVSNDVEPNNTKSQAKNLPLNNVKTGQIGYYYNGVSDTEDWFKVTTTGDGALKLTIISQNGQYVYYQLFDNDGITSLNVNHTNSTQSITTDGLAAGTYYVKIYPYYAGGFIPYTLSDTLIPAPVANDPEPNDGKSQATEFAVGSTITGHSGYYYDLKRDDADYFKIVTTLDGQINLTITSQNGQYVYYELFDEDATTSLKVNHTNSTQSHSTDGLAAGTYYVKVYPYYSTGFIPYTLTNSLTTYTNVNDGINNEIAKKAATLPANFGNTGHVGFRSNGGAVDLKDWWKINYTGSGDLTVALTWEPMYCCGSPYVYLKVYSDTALAPIFNTYNNTGSLTANFTGLAKQYYYVQVVMYYATNYTAYNLVPTFSQKEKASITLQSSVIGTDCSNSSLEYKCGKSSKPYTVQLYRFGEKYGDPIKVNKTTPFTISSLPPGKYYTTVYGDGATGQGKGTSETTVLVQVPTNLSTTSIKSTKATLNWDTLTCIDYDSIYYRVQNTSIWSKIKTGTNNSGYKLEGLTAATTYEWKVAHVVDVLGNKATSSYSGLVTFTTAPAKLVGEVLNEFTGTLSLYPNPASATTTLQFKNDTGGEALMSVFDALGRNIQSELLQSEQVEFSYELNLATFSPGIYFVRVVMNGTEQTIKLVKQ